MTLSTTEIAAILGSDLDAPPKPVWGYSIDSRTVQNGELFFAIRGIRHDGHEFIGEALERGAAAAIVEATSPKLAGLSSGRLIRVQDTTRALQDLALAVRRKWSGRIVGITGSAGKTTTKEMIAAILAQQCNVLKSSGNLNNHYGVPLTLLKLEPWHDVGVIEMAMSGPGEIALLASIAEPQIGVVTNVAPAHLQFFDSVDGVARAKRELIEHLHSPAVAVLNRDDERVRHFSDGFKGRVLTFGLEEGADYRGLNVHTAPGSFPAMEFDLQGGPYHERISIPLAGCHNVENALAAIATASLFEASPQNVRAALSQFQALGQRTEIVKLPGDLTIVNDAYNSNPRAMERMLETLAGWPGAGRRIVVAGEMLELGPSSAEWHHRIGRLCAQSGTDWLLAVQGDAREFLEGAIEAGLPRERALFFSEPADAGRFCQKIARPGDVILVKGSRGVRLEKAIDVLRQEPPASAGPCSGVTVNSGT
jgi:UDP-N-acetylmuramoyl-tripeptide--D-alanyl-D-alanine ligase